MVKQTNSGGRTKWAKERSIVNCQPASRRWRDEQTTSWTTSKRNARSDNYLGWLRDCVVLSTLCLGGYNLHVVYTTTVLFFLKKREWSQSSIIFFIPLEQAELRLRKWLKARINFPLFSITSQTIIDEPIKCKLAKMIQSTHLAYLSTNVLFESMNKIKVSAL